MKFSFNINGIWIFSACLTSMISLISYRGNPLLEDSSYYFAYQLGYLFLIALFSKFTLLKRVKLSKMWFALGALVLLFSQPLFEDDHYRYIWEGRVFAHGENPYINAPDSKKLNYIDYNRKKQIGFSYLTTVYPPVSILWFSIGGILSPDYRISLVVLMILNSILVFILLSRIENYIKSEWLLFLILPLLQKEYIQSVHIDLFAFLWILPLFFETNKKHYRDIGLIFLSIFSKVIGIFFVFPLILKHINELRTNIMFWIISTLLLLSFPLFYLYLKSINGVHGYEAFGGSWVWNPGFYSIFSRGFGFEDITSRKITIYSFLIYTITIGLFTIAKYKRNKYVFTKELLWGITYLFFSGLIFFTPVYNSWYVIWFLVPALLLNLKFGVLYSFFSFTCYMKYFNPDLLPWAEFFGHLFFIPSLYEYFKSAE
jgi:alpha-1,6-mannosyltransferase